jgi:hypothetical protein
MAERLNVGPGLCQATARLTVKPVRAVIELGAAPDVLAQALAAVHHVNRRGDPEDFIAVALPARRPGRVRALPGEEIELIGSQACLASLLVTDGFVALRRRGMIRHPEIFEAEREPGETGAAYIRDRIGEKWTAGGIERMRRRAARRGVYLREITRKPVSLSDRLTLFFGTAPINVREIVAAQSDEPLKVSTYGFSASAAPAILPVLPNSVMIQDDAA